MVYNYAVPGTLCIPIRTDDVHPGALCYTRHVCTTVPVVSLIGPPDDGRILLRYEEKPRMS